VGLREYHIIFWQWELFGLTEWKSIFRTKLINEANKEKVKWMTIGDGS
jgi:hypothetical protein